ncbi:MAG: VWA domain-containing protein [Planctomycetes bacterium]|nr:VWA domain-containing protein [Planctomycetota bacterium]
MSIRVLPLLVFLSSGVWAGDPALDSAIAARDVNGIIVRMRSLVDEDQKNAVKLIPKAYAQVELLSPDQMDPSDKYRVFAGALAALLRVQEGAGFTALSRGFEKEKDWPARFLILRVAWQHGKMDPIDLALKGITAKEPQVVAMAARILGRSKSVQAIRPVIAAMEKWERKEHREKVHTGREEVMAEVGGRAWIACRDALNRLTGESLHSALDYRNYVKSHEGQIDPAKVVIKEKTEHEGQTGLGLFGLDLSGRNIIFILDISGSMETTDPFTPEQIAELNRPGRTRVGDKDPLEEKFLQERKRILRAKKELIKVVKSLPEDKNFNIVIYSNDVTPWKSELVDATRDQKDSAEKFIEAIQPHGVTFTDEALRLSLEDPSVDTVYLITDGAPTHVGTRGKDLPPDAQQLMQDILTFTRTTNYLRGVRIFTLGFEGAEEGFLKKLSEENEGDYVRIR